MLNKIKYIFRLIPTLLLVVFCFHEFITSPFIHQKISILIVSMLFISDVINIIYLMKGRVDFEKRLDNLKVIILLLLFSFIICWQSIAGDKDYALFCVWALFLLISICTIYKFIFKKDDE